VSTTKSEKILESTSHLLPKKKYKGGQLTREGEKKLVLLPSHLEGQTILRVFQWDYVRNY